MERPTRQREHDGTQEQETEESEQTCPECESTAISTDGSGELICEDCGLVIEDENIDRGPEWRAFNHSERQSKSRVGAPTTQTMHDKGLTTTIDWKDKDAYGRSLSSEKRSQMHRLRKWQERIRTKDAGERNLQFALSEIDRMASALGLPRSVREVASVIYRRALNEDLIRGRSIEGVATSCLYAACRQEGIPRSLEEVSDVSRVEQKEIGRTYRYVAQELKLKMEPVDPKQYVLRRLAALQREEDPARGRRRSTGHGSHDPKPLPGTDRSDGYPLRRTAIGPYDVDYRGDRRNESTKTGTQHRPSVELRGRLLRFFSKRPATPRSDPLPARSALCPRTNSVAPTG